MNRTIIKSPIFYMGNKYKLLKDLKSHFPNDINNFYDVFGGSGAVALNTDARIIHYNELDSVIFNLFKMFHDYGADKIISHIKGRISEFGLIKGADKKDSKEYKYLAMDRYKKFRNFFNKQGYINYLDLYVLTYYSFSNLIRFNKSGGFNMPVGKQRFLKVHEQNIKTASNRLKNIGIKFTNNDAIKMLESIEFSDNDFVYVDPPYMNTSAIYSEKGTEKEWSKENDLKLFDVLDKLSEKGVSWALSNVTKHRGVKNAHLIEWARKYNVIFLNKSYFSLGKGDAQSQEVLVLNYESD